MNQMKKPSYAYAHGGSDTLLPTELCFARKVEVVSAVAEPTPQEVVVISVDQQASFLPMHHSMTVKGADPDADSYDVKLSDNPLKVSDGFWRMPSVGHTHLADLACAKLEGPIILVSNGVSSKAVRDALDPNRDFACANGPEVPYTILNAEGRARIAELYRSALTDVMKKGFTPRVSGVVLFGPSGQGKTAIMNALSSPPVTERDCEKCEGKGSYLLLSPFPQTCTECHGKGKVV